jgi:hypothetical protein
MPIKPGNKAPDFTLYSSDKKQVSLSDYHGKNVLLLFFPLAFTSTCTKELCGVRDRVYNFDGLNVEVLAIPKPLPNGKNWNILISQCFQILTRWYPRPSIQSMKPSAWICTASPNDQHS